MEAMRSDAAGPWDFGYMEFVILLDTQIGNGQLNIQIGGSGCKLHRIRGDRLAL